MNKIKNLKQELREMAAWKIIVLNIIVGAIITVPSFIGMVCFTGLFGIRPTLTDKIIGLGIFGIVLFIIFFSNFMLLKCGNNINSYQITRNDNHYYIVKIIIGLIIGILPIIILFSFI